MNRKQWIIAGVAVAVVVAAVLVWQTTNEPKVKFSGPERIEDNPQSLPEGVPDPESFQDKADIEKLLEKEGNRLGTMKLLASGANKPIEFYARVVDQYGNPITGADVKMQVAQADVMGSWVNIAAKTRTDNDGRFSLSGTRGESYQLTNIQKSGYIFNDSVNKLFWNRRRNQNMQLISTTPENPWIYKGWKIEEVADIKTIRVGGKVIPDGRLYTVNLSDKSSEKMEFQEGRDGDITISITRDVTPKENNWYAYEYNSWSFTMQIANGGIVEIPQEEASGYLYMAPESGYISSVSSSSNKEAPDWKREFKLHYYVKLDNGKSYGHIKVYIGPFFREKYADVSIRGALNVDGGRNLLSKDNIK